MNNLRTKLHSDEIRMTLLMGNPNKGTLLYSLTNSRNDQWYQVRFKSVEDTNNKDKLYVTTVEFDTRESVEKYMFS